MIFRIHENENEKVICEMGAIFFESSNALTGFDFPSEFLCNTGYRHDIFV